jgi:phosphoglycolate phosphatase
MPNKTAKSLLIFDLDGTLYRTESSFVPTMKAIYAEHGVQYVGDDVVLSAIGEPYGTLLRWMVSEGFPEDEVSLAQEITRREHESIASDGVLYPKVAETLHTLKSAGHLLAICTNGNAAYVDAILGKFGLLPLFDAIKAHADAGQTKTEMVAELMERFQPERAAMIGDRYHDFESGRANGCVVVAATYGFAEDWKTADFDIRLERFVELPRLLADYDPQASSSDREQC